MARPNEVADHAEADRRRLVCLDRDFKCRRRAFEAKHEIFDSEIDRAVGVPAAAVSRGPQFSDSIVLIGAALAGLGIAIGRAPHVMPLLARGQLVRVTQESWIAPWSYYLMAPAAHFRRPIVRSFVDWALEESRSAGS